MGTKKKKTLKTKIILIGFFLLAVPSLLIGITGYFNAKSELDEAGKINLKNNVQYTLALIEVMDEQVKKGNISLEEAQEKVKETILGKKREDGTRPISKHFDLGKNGYIFILDEKANEVAHPLLEGKNIWNTKSKDGLLVGKELVQLGEKGGGYLEFDWPLPNSQKTAEKITYVEKDPHWGWIVNAGTYFIDFNEGANHIIYILLITLGVSLLAGAALILLYSERMIRPLKDMEAAVSKIADGDLTVEEINVNRRDEIGRLADRFNHMTSQLKTIIKEVGLHTQHVAASSEQLMASAEETSKATEQISNTMQDIFSGAEQQLRQAEQTALAADEMKTSIHQIVQRTSETVQSAEHASSLAKDGERSLEKVVHQMQNIQSIAQNLGNIIMVLNGQSKDIENIIKVISDIADQTNLLALNASIEAARAGEHGKGFSVVASEVRKLAEQSTSSAKQITEIIAKIQENTLHAKSTMELANTEVDNGMAAIEGAGSNFSLIKDSIEKVLSEIEDITNKANSVVEGTDQVVAAVNQSAQIAQEATAGTETAASAAEEQLASMEEVSASATALANQAEELQRLLEKFKL